MPAMTDSWCQLKWCCRIDVSPLGAQVRTRVRRSLSPNSSMKTMMRPCFAALFLELASETASSA